jgi:hypothetical protein
MNPEIKQLIEAAIMAPSGENCQPWRFEVGESQIRLFNHPESDQSLYNFRQRGSLISHGAVLENMAIAGAGLGYKFKFDLFPDEGEPNLVALITWEKVSRQADPLASAITRRITNRKEFKMDPLAADDRVALEKAAASVKGGGAELKFITDRPTIDRLAKALSTNERVLFENKFLHHFFFDHIRWTKAEDTINPSGFFLPTLELSAPEAKGFSLFKNWPVVAVLKHLGLGKKVGAANLAKYRAASALLAFSLPAAAGEADFVNLGRMMERVWLTATNHQFWLQPATGVLFINQRLSAGDSAHLNPKQKNLIKEAYREIEKDFGWAGQNKVITLLFRLGHGEPPSAQASRYALEYFYSLK